MAYLKDIPEAHRDKGLPRVEQIIVCSQEQCICGKCGKPTVVIGYETAEQLDREPAKYFVRVLKREKRACSSWHKEESRRQPCRLELLRRAWNGKLA
jgi:transposase